MTSQRISPNGQRQLREKSQTYYKYYQICFENAGNFGPNENKKEGATENAI